MAAPQTASSRGSARQWEVLQRQTTTIARTLEIADATNIDDEVF